MEDLIDFVGFNGPIFITLITIQQLFNQTPYLIGFVVFNLMNIKLNEFLKMCLKEPRPEKIDLEKEQKMHVIYKIKELLQPLFTTQSSSTTNDSIFHVNPSHIYGMPSGHAQTAAFALGFLFFAKKSPKSSVPPMMFMIAFFILLVTLFQRWYRNKHTIHQLIVGCFVGFLVSGLAYNGIKNYLLSNTIRI